MKNLKTMKPLIILARYIAKKYLTSVSKRYGFQRKAPFAVFAHDWIGLKVFLDGIYEERHLDYSSHFIKKVIRADPDAICVDIGANIGNHSIYYAQYFHRVIAFEPSPRIYPILSYNTSSYPNISPFNAGISSVKQRLNSTSSPLNLGGTSAILYPSTDLSTSPVNTLELAPIDYYISNTQNIKFIKIDVEGMEYDVLISLIDVIKTNQPVVAMEHHLSHFDSSNSNTSDCVKLLQSLNYKFCWFKYNRTFKALLPWHSSQIPFSKLVNDVPVDHYPQLLCIPHHLHSS